MLASQAAPLQHTGCDTDMPPSRLRSVCSRSRGFWFRVCDSSRMFWTQHATRNIAICLAVQWLLLSSAVFKRPVSTAPSPVCLPAALFRSVCVCVCVWSSSSYSWKKSRRREGRVWRRLRGRSVCLCVCGGVLYCIWIHLGQRGEAERLLCCSGLLESRSCGRSSALVTPVVHSDKQGVLPETWPGRESRTTGLTATTLCVEFFFSVLVVRRSVQHANKLTNNSHLWIKKKKAYVRSHKCTASLRSASGRSLAPLVATLIKQCNIKSSVLGLAVWIKLSALPQRRKKRKEKTDITGFSSPEHFRITFSRISSSPSVFVVTMFSQKNMCIFVMSQRALIVQFFETILFFIWCFNF